MEKTIEVDGRDVKFKSTAGTARRYRAQFGADFFADIGKLAPMIDAMDIEEDDEDEKDEISVAVLQHFNFEVFENVAWVLAKTADKTIPEPLEWLESFDVFPMEIMGDLMELIVFSFRSKKNKHHMVKMQNQ